MKNSGDCVSAEVVYSSLRWGTIAVLALLPIGLGLSPALAGAQTAGSALQFDGVNDKVKMSPEGLDGVEDFTVEFWTRLVQTSGQTHDWISGANAGNSDELRFCYRDGALWMRVRQSDWVRKTLPSSLDNGKWHHVAATRAGETVRFFVDGSQVGLWEGAQTGPLHIEAEGLWLGARQGSLGGGWITGEFLKGGLDELRIWNYARVEAEIRAAMNQRAEPREWGLVGYWNFDEGSGQIVNDLTRGARAGQLGDTPDARSDDPQWISSGLPAPGATLNNPAGGQLGGDFSGAAEQVGVPLIGFRIDPPEQGFPQIVFRFNDQTGLVWNQLRNPRLVLDRNGNGVLDGDETTTVGGPPTLTTVTDPSVQPNAGWEWINGEAWSYTSWGANQPDNAGGVEDCLVFWSRESSYPYNPSRWNDAPDSAAGFFLVEFEPGWGTAPSGWINPVPFTPVYCPVTQHWYAAITQGRTWNEANQVAQSLACNGMLGHLATITSEEENNWLRTGLGLPDNGQYWLGGRQKADRLVTFSQFICPPPEASDAGFILTADAIRLAQGQKFVVQLEADSTQTSPTVELMLNNVTRAVQAIPPAAALLDHPAGQVRNQLRSSPDQADIPMFGFRLKNAGYNVASIQFDLSELVGITMDTLRAASLVVDTNANGRVDPGEPPVGGSPEIVLPSFQDPYVFYQCDFDSGVLGQEWEGSGDAGWLVDFKPGRSGTGARLAHGSGWGNAYLDLTVDFAERSDFLLNFDCDIVYTQWYSYGSSLQISADGSTFQNLAWSPPALSDGWLLQFVDLTAEARRLGLTLGHDTRLRWTFRSEQSGSDYGLRLDNVRILAVPRSGSIRFSQPFATGNSYLLTANFVGLPTRGRLTTDLDPSRIILSGGVSAFGDVAAATQVVAYPYQLSLNPRWQPPTDFGAQPHQVALPLLGFNLEPAGRAVDSLTVDFTGVHGIAGPDIENVILYADWDGDGMVSAGDAMLDTGSATISDDSGTVVFPRGFQTMGDLLVTADLSNLERGDRLQLAANPGGVSIPERWHVAGSAEAYHCVNMLLEDSPGEQIPDRLGSRPIQNDVEVFGFTIQTFSQDTRLGAVTFRVNGKHRGAQTGDFSSFSMDADPGWTYEGLWAWGHPTGGGSSCLDPSAGYTGQNVVGYNLNGNYSDSMPVYRVTTSPLDCSDYQNIHLRFWRRLGIESSSFDHADVQVSRDGSAWTTLWAHQGSGFCESNWVLCDYDISAVADGQPAVHARWSLGPTDGSGTYPGWNIDDVCLRGDALTNLRDMLSAASLVADRNGNGLVDPGEPRYSAYSLEDIPGSPDQALRFEGSFDVQSPYLLVMDLHNLDAGDEVGVSLEVGNLDLTTTGCLTGSTTSVVQRVEAPYEMAAHPDWSHSEDFRAGGEAQNVALLGFRLTGPDRQVLGVRIDLADVAGVATDDIRNAALYRDVNGDGHAGAEDVRLADGQVDLVGRLGGIRFATPFSCGDSYLVAADIANVAAGDRMTICLPVENIEVPPRDFVVGSSFREYYCAPFELADPATGQEPDNLSGWPEQPGVELLGFRLIGDGDAAGTITLLLNDLLPPEGGRLASPVLALDSNDNGTLDEGEPRLAVGDLTQEPREVLFSDGFESAGFGSQWSISGLETWRVRVDPAFRCHGNYGAGMDSTGWSWATDRMDLHLQVQKYCDLRLAFQINNVADEMEAEDGVYLSADGVNFFKTSYRFPASGTSWHSDAIDLSAEARNLGLVLDSDIFLRWQNRCNEYYSYDGVLIDDVEVTARPREMLLRFVGPFPTGQSYIAAGDFSLLGPGDQLTASLDTSDIELLTTGCLIGSVTPVTHRVEAPYLLSSHPRFLPVTNFGTQETQTDVPLFAFRLAPAGRPVEALALQLTNVAGISQTDISNARLYHDTDGDGRLGADDEFLDTGDAQIVGDSGQVAFGGGFITQGDLLVLADFTGLAAYDQLTVSLGASDVVVPPQYVVGGAAPPVSYWVRGSVDVTQNNRHDWSLTYRSPGGTSASGRFNHEGDRVILAYDTGAAWVFDAYTNTPLLLIKDVYDELKYAGFSPDDREIVTVTRDGAVFVWDAATGSQVRGMFSDLMVTAAVPSPDSRLLLVLVEGKALMLDIESESVLWEYIRGTTTVTSVGYSPNGNDVVIGCGDRLAYRLDARTGAERKSYRGHTQAVTTTIFLRDGTRLLTASPDELIQIWDISDGVHPLRTLSLAGAGAVGAAASPDGRRIAVVVGAGTGARLRLYDAENPSVPELFESSLAAAGTNWGGTFKSMTFDDAGQRILVTSTGGGYAQVACYNAANGAYLRSWGPQGNFTSQYDSRPRISQDGDRIFYMTDQGMTLLHRTPGLPLAPCSRLATARGFDINDNGTSLAWFDAGQLHVESVGDTAFQETLLSNLGISYNSIAMSPSGARVLAGDRVFSAMTGDLLGDYPSADGEYPCAFSPDEQYWGFSKESEHSIIVIRTDDPDANLDTLVFTDLTDVYAPNRIAFHPDGLRVGCVDTAKGVVQFYNRETNDPHGLNLIPAGAVTALSKDGTLLLAGKGNKVDLYRVGGPNPVRSFTPQLSSLAGLQVRSVEFARDDTLILIAWSANYVETYERSFPASLEVYPSARDLAPGQSQSFQLQVTYNNNSRQDVTAELGKPEKRAWLEIVPPGAAVVEGDTITVAAEPGAEAFTVRAHYRESNTHLQANAAIGVRRSHVAEFLAAPSAMTVNPGVFRPISYSVRYDDGYQEDVTPSVVLTASRPKDVQIDGQRVQARYTAPPGEIAVTGRYVDGEGEEWQAQTVLSVFGLKTAWERMRLTGGGYVLSGCFNADGSALALGCSSGAVNFYDVPEGATPTQYVFRGLLDAHDLPIRYVEYLGAEDLLTAGEDGLVRRWDLATSPSTETFTYRHPACILSVGRHDDLLALGDVRGYVTVYDLNAGNVVWSLRLHDGPVAAVAIDSQYVLSGGEDARMLIRSSSSGSRAGEFMGHARPILSVGFLGTGYLYVAAEDHAMTLLNRGDFSPADRYEYGTQLSGAELLDGRLLVSALDPVQTWVYDDDGLMEYWVSHSPSRGRVAHYIGDAAGKYLFTGRQARMFWEMGWGGAKQRVSAFSSCQAWDAARSTYRGGLLHSYPLERVHIGADASRLFSQSEKRTLQWDFASDHSQVDVRRLMELGYFTGYQFCGLDATVDSGILAARVGPSIYLFDTADDLLFRTVQSPEAAGPFALSPDGALLATSGSGVTRLWDILAIPPAIIRTNPVNSISLEFPRPDRWLGASPLEPPVPGDPFLPPFVHVWDENGIQDNGGYTPTPAELGYSGEALDNLAGYRVVAMASNRSGTSYVAASELQFCCDAYCVTSFFDYWLHVYDFSNPDDKPVHVRDIFLLRTQCMNGAELVTITPAISEDGVLVLAGISPSFRTDGSALLNGFTDARAARLIHVPSGATLREFLPPSGRSLWRESQESNVGPLAVEFADNDDTVMIGWAEGFAELYRRARPQRLDLALDTTGTLTQADASDVADAARRQTARGIAKGGDPPAAVILKPGDTARALSVVSYANGEQLNVTTTAHLSVDRPDLVTIEGSLLTVSLTASSALVTLTSSYEEPGEEAPVETQLIFEIEGSPLPTPSPTSSGTPVPGADSDSDGIEDAYEIAHGSNPNDPGSLPANLDLNGSGVVDRDDALLLYNWLIGLAAPDPGADLDSLDLNGDGAVTILDALLFYRNRMGTVPVIPRP